MKTRFETGEGRACNIDHRAEIPREIETLLPSQAGYWRHRCAGCAYVLGRSHAAETEKRLRDRVRALMDEVDQLKAALQKKPG